MNLFTSLFLIFGLMTIVLSIDRPTTQADFFIDATLASSWTDYLSTQKVGYFQDFENLAHIRGTVQTTSALPSVIFQLPASFAPSQTLTFSVVSFSASSPLSVGEVQINKKGEVVATKGKTVFSLDGISFELPEKKVVKRNTVSRANFVIPRGFPFSSLFPFPPQEGPVISANPSVTALYRDECPNFKTFWRMNWNGTSYAESNTFYCVEHDPANPQNTDQIERVRMRGQFNLMNVPMVQTVGNVPAGRLPNKPLRVCAVSQTGPVRVDIAAGAVWPKGYKTQQFSLDGIEYFLDQVNNWNLITNWQNGYNVPSTNFFVEEFLPKDPYTVPGFRLDSAGKVHLKGIVAVPTTITKGQVFTLPEGFRPRETIYRCGATRRGAVTLSISPLGWVSVVDVFGSANVEWLSLDGIHFATESLVPFTSPNAKVYLEDNVYNFEVSVEDNQNSVLVDFHEQGEYINFPSKPVTVIGTMNEKLVQASLSLDPTTKKGKVEFSEFAKPTGLIGGDWTLLDVPIKNKVDQSGRTQAAFVSAAPAWMFDRNKNLVLLRGRFYLSENPVVFSLPSWVHIEREFYFLLEGSNGATYPLTVHTNGQVTFVGQVSRSDAVLVDITNLHFSASVGQPARRSTRI